MTEDKEEKQIKENSRKTVSPRRLFLFIAGLVLVCGALGLTLTKMWEYRHSEKIYEEAEARYISVAQVTAPASGEGQTPTAERDVESAPVQGRQPEWYELFCVDMEALCADHPQVIGWLRFEDGEISYPIAFSGDNEKYLKTAYTGERAVGGSVFLDAESSTDFSDPHSLLYGHNMNDGSMFGKLWRYHNRENYLPEHRYFQIITPEASYRYEIFAYGTIPASDLLYEVYGKEPLQLETLVKKLNGMAAKETQLRAETADHIVTLSTCGAKDSRLVVCAVRIAEHKAE